jgi:hypothetical protein
MPLRELAAIPASSRNRAIRRVPATVHFWNWEDEIGQSFRHTSLAKRGNCLSSNDLHANISVAEMLL